MRKLFDRFAELSVQAQELLEKGIAQMRDGFAPDATLCNNIANTLANLRSSYDTIRHSIPEHILAEELPDGDLSVHEYEEIWKNSVVSRQNAVRQVLEEFIRVYSEEKKYMDAIQPHIRNAVDLLSEIKDSGNQAQSFDISIYELFLEGLKADLDQNEDLYDQLLDVFVGRIVNGLKDNKYYIREFSDAEIEIQQDRNNEPSVEAGDECVGSQSLDLAERQEVRETPKPEEYFEGSILTEANDVAGKEKTESPDGILDEFIHPRIPIRDIKMPSDQKLKELIHSSHSVLGYLLDKLCCTGLLDENRVFEIVTQLPQHPITESACQDIIAYLERKGYLSVYQYEGRNILCFNSIMKECTKKQGHSNTLKRLLNLKKIGDIYICSQQDMPLKEFREHLELVDHYHYVVDRLNEDKESLDILPMCSWDAEANVFFLHLKRPGKSSLPLMLVQPDALPTVDLLTDRGAFTYSESLPEMNCEDTARYCLTPEGLYNWDGSQWIAITHADKTPTSQKTSRADEKKSSVEGSSFETNDEIVVKAIAQDNVSSADEIIDEHVADEEPDKTISVPSAQSADVDDVTVAETGFTNNDDNSQCFRPIYEEDLSAYEIVEGMDPQKIAEKILEYGISPEHVSVYMHLFETLIEDGTIIRDGSVVHDNMAQAIILLKSLMPFDQVYADKLERLVYATDSTLQAHHYTGRDIMTIFESESAFLQDHPVEKLMTVMRAMVSPDTSHDYDLNSYSDSLFNNYDHVFPGLDIIKPIYNLLLRVKKYSSNGFSLQILRKTDDKQVEKQMQSAVVSKARELLMAPAAGNGFIAMPLMMARCFDSESTLGTCLKYIADDRRDEREFVEMAFCEEFCEKVGQVFELSDTKIDLYFESRWAIVLSQYRKVQDLNASQAKKVYTNIRERLDVIRQWLDLTDETNTDKNSLGQLVALKKEIIFAIDQAMANINQCGSYDRTIIRVALDGIKNRLENALIVKDNEFADFLRTGYVILSENGMPSMDDAVSLNDPFPAWRNVLRHISEPVISLDDTLMKISKKESIPLFDNIGQAFQICSYLGKDATPYLDDLVNAKALAHKAVDTFKGELELAFAYGRLSEDEKEDILEELQFGTEAFFEHQYFGTLRFYLPIMSSPKC